jgi:hypothetical protein
MDTNLKLLIIKLPLVLQKKIYILCFKNFWKKFIPITAKIPSWYYRYSQIEKIKYEAILKNIHFLHLPFNTLTENKKWIPGCQCDFCKKYSLNHKNEIYKIQGYCFLDPLYFLSIMPSSYSSHHNDEYILHPNLFLEFRYDPLCNSPFEDTIRYSIRNNEQIDFSDEINLYPYLP